MRSILFAILTVVVFSGSAIARGCGENCGCKRAPMVEDESKETTAEVVNADNKICPVMGGEIIEGRSVKIEHEGEIYNLCCAGCIGKFENDPEKYIEKIKENTQESPKDDYCSDVQSCHG